MSRGARNARQMPSQSTTAADLFLRSQELAQLFASPLEHRSSFGSARELLRTMQLWRGAIPSLNPELAKALSDPTVAVIAARHSALSRTPLLAPEFLESLAKLHRMNTLLHGPRDILAATKATSIDRQLLKAAIDAFSLAAQVPKELRTHLIVDQWPTVQAFQFDGADALLANIDLSKEFDKPSSERSSLLIEESGRVKRIIIDIFRGDSTLIHLESQAFEEVVAELLRSKGFIVDMTKRTRDGGYDLIAITQQSGFPLKYLVECKRYSEEKIGIDIIRSLMYVVGEQKANKGIIATTSYFTRDARLHQQSVHPYQLDLRDKNDILGWIQEYGENFLQLGKS